MNTHTKMPENHFCPQRTLSLIDKDKGTWRSVSRTHVTQTRACKVLLGTRNNDPVKAEVGGEISLDLAIWERHDQHWQSRTHALKDLKLMAGVAEPRVPHAALNMSLGPMHYSPRKRKTHRGNWRTTQASANLQGKGIVLEMTKWSKLKAGLWGISGHSSGQRLAQGTAQVAAYEVWVCPTCWGSSASRHSWQDCPI